MSDPKDTKIAELGLNTPGLRWRDNPDAVGPRLTPLAHG